MYGAVLLLMETFCALNVNLSTPPLFPHSTPLLHSNSTLEPVKPNHTHAQQKLL